MNFNYQKKKFENLKLSDDVLTAIGSEETDEKNKTSDEKSSKRVAVKNSIKKFSLNGDIKESSLSDFIPLKTYS